jgi:hypothetical protein
MNSNSPRILLIGSTYRAICVLERLLERGDRVVAFIGLEGGVERDFCPEILELCDRQYSRAQRAEARRGGSCAGSRPHRPDLAIALGGSADVPLSIAGTAG